MGRTADRKNRKRAQYLAVLALVDHERFRREWQKRVQSWHADIWKRAGKLRDGYGDPIPPAFGVIDVARRSLEQCQDAAAILEGWGSIEALTDEATKALAVQIDPRLHHLVQKLEKE